MTVSAPNGEVFAISAETGTRVFQLAGGEIKDGIYPYELRAATEEEVEIVYSYLVEIQGSGRSGMFETVAIRTSPTSV